jgi:hypothetical protein
MKRIRALLSVLVLFGSFGVSAAKAADGVVLKEELVPGSYCHEQFPAIREDTIAGNQPVLKNADTGDIIDFYGPCGENPLGKDQIAAQRDQDELLFRENQVD